jgi:hypothetical protein
MKRLRDDGMRWNRFINGIGCLMAPACLCIVTNLLLLCAAHAQAAPPPQEQEDADLVILNESQLPDTYLQGAYMVRLEARGGVPPLHWRVEKGALPAGIKLDATGLLHGAAEHTGQFQFTASVRDSGSHAVEKNFVIWVHSALEIKWKSFAHVSGNRIDGSVEVSNATADDMDLTFIVLAVAPNGRATAIGYQHFNLHRGTFAMELPFGDTLPHGAYVVYVDAVGEVAPKNLIYRQQLQTNPLQVTVSP